jgi:hypothetical protein
MTPKAGHHLHVAEHAAIDQVPYSRAHLPSHLLVHVIFLRPYQPACVQGFRGQVTRWLLRLAETSLGTFAQWQIALALGDYIFEDFGNALTIVAQKPGTKAILLSFPVTTSQAWGLQGIYRNNVPWTLELLDHLESCILPCFVSRGPRVGGFLHPACYGIPGDNDNTKGSCQAFYVPTTIFEGNGLVITTSHSAAYYRGRAASYFA